MFRKSEIDPFNRELLDFLLDLYETRKMTQSAKNLGMSQAAASRALEKLRQTFSDQLFVANGHGMEPTVLMQGLLEDLRNARRALERLTEPRTFDPSTTSRVFRIASRGLVEPCLLSYLVQRVAKEAPGAKLEHIYRAEDSFDALLAGDLDFVVSTDLAIPPMLHCLPLFPIELGVMVAKHHPLLKQYGTESPSLADFLQYRRIGLKITPTLESATFDRQVFGEAGQKAVIAQTDEPLAMVSVIAETNAMMVAPRAGVEFVARYFNVTWMPLPKSVAIPNKVGRSVLVWGERRHTDEGHIWVRSLFRDWIEMQKSPGRISSTEANGKQGKDTKVDLRKK